jgi:3-oxoacyl-[acyl-carrier protein] reductase
MTENALDGKTVIITGGGRGLGREMAVAFAGAGAQGVTITGAPGGQGHAVLADVASDADCARVVADTLDHFGGLNILINNAGKAGRYVHHGKGSMAISDGDPAGFREVIETNVLGPFLMAHAAAAHLVAAGWGRIINISKSVDSMHRSAITPYGPSKAALEAATIAWAEAMAETCVTVNSLSPGGAINTKFGTGEIPGRGLDPTVIVPMALWLASPASDGINGCRYVADRWDDSLPPDQAAEGCRECAVFPKPRRDTPLTKAWVPPG